MAKMQRRRVYRRVGGRRKVTTKVGLRVPIFFCLMLLVTGVPAILMNLSLQKWEHQYRMWRDKHPYRPNEKQAPPRLRFDWTGSGE